MRVAFARGATYGLLAVPLLIRLIALRLTTLPAGAGAYLRLIGWELPVLIGLVAMVEWRQRLESRPGRFGVLIMVVGLWTILLADALVFHIFGLRLTFPDVVRYGTRARDVVAFLDPRLVLAALAAAVLTAGVAVRAGAPIRTAGDGQGGLRARLRRDPALAVLPFVAVTAFLAAATLNTNNDGDPHGWVYGNWVSLNTQNSLFEPYSRAFADSVVSAGGPGLRCPTGGEPASRPDVLVVLLESFSSGFTPLYGGSRSHLPQLERISADGLHFTRFLANGFSTEHGLIAVLGGTLPVFPAGVDARSLAGYMSFSGFQGLEHSLAACTAELGYHTEFLTSGDLSFTDKGSWLRSIGFARVEGHDAPRYAGLRRGMFDAVSDSVLYDRAIDRLSDLRAAGGPYLLVVEGVDSHGPYRGRHGLRLALEGADADLGIFYDRLRATGFLEDGLLVLVSDHRAQVPLDAVERERFGAEAAVRVPAVLVGSRIPQGEDTLPRHQLDVLPTVLNYLMREPVGAGQSASMLAPPPERCLPWLSAGRRDEVLASCPEGVVRIRLDGDHTRVVEGELSSRVRDVIGAIHRARLDGARPERQSADVATGN